MDLGQINLLGLKRQQKLAVSGVLNSLSCFNSQPKPQEPASAGSSVSDSMAWSQAPMSFDIQQVDAEVGDGGLITLLIRHLPEAIPQETVTRLFTHYGATSVRPCTSGRMKNCAFLDFKNEAAAYQALRQLNGLRFLGKVLSVERATKRNQEKQSEEKDLKSPSSLAKDASVNRVLSEGLKSGSIPGSEPIAPRLGVDYPFPPHLEYAYPPPDGNILTNIVNALIAVPRFYTQVLHLMNKMNIPAPFRMALPTPPLPPSTLAPLPPSQPASSVASQPTGSESEMDSSDEEDQGQALKSGKKRKRRETIVGPAVDKDVDHEAVGVKPAFLVPKEKPVIKKKNPVLQIKITPKVIQNEHKDEIMEKESEEPDISGSCDKTFATLEEIKSKRLAPEEILSLPRFKNYTVGDPASVLYIKNLSKDVVAEDFFYIFGSLFGSIDAAKTGLSVKLMQEGRMRGQAFVTFPSVELAHQALNLVNGFVFKEKPMIIQFGRNPQAAKAN